MSPKRLLFAWLAVWLLSGSFICPGPEDDYPEPPPRLDVGASDSGADVGDASRAPDSMNMQGDTSDDDVSPTTDGGIDRGD